MPCLVVFPVPYVARDPPYEQTTSVAGAVSRYVVGVPRRRLKTTNAPLVHGAAASPPRFVAWIARMTAWFAAGGGWAAAMKASPPPGGKAAAAAVELIGDQASVVALVEIFLASEPDAAGKVTQEVSAQPARWLLSMHHGTGFGCSKKKY